MSSNRTKWGAGWAITIACGVLLSIAAEARTFTATDGRTIQATPVKISGDSAVLKRNSGQTVTVPFGALIEADRKFLAEWAKQEAKDRVPRVKVEIDSNKRDALVKSGYEERRGSFQFKISVTNEERDFKIEKATGTLIVLGDYLYEKGITTVMQRAEFKDITMDFGKTFVMNGEEVRYEYDRHGYTHGQKYSGFVFILKTASGKIIDISGSTTRYENLADLIVKLKQGDYCNKSFQKVKTSRSSSGILR